MHVEARMTREVAACHAEHSLAAAASRMRDHDCGCLPVVDGAGHVVGMITDRDICMAALATGAALSTLRVAEAMTGAVVTTRPLDSLEDAERTMRQHRVRRLPVVDDQARLNGILSCNDLFRGAAANGDGNGHRPGTAAHEAIHLVGTLAAIGEARRPRESRAEQLTLAPPPASRLAPSRVAAPRDRLAQHAPAPARTFHSRGATANVTRATGPPCS